MGSYIGMGFIINNELNSRRKSDIQMILEYFISKSGKLINVKFSEDEDGNSWKDIKEPNIESVDKFLSKYYLNFNLICNILDKKDVIINAYYTNLSKDFCGLLLDFDVEYFLKGCPDEKIEEKTNQFINLMIDIYNVVKYSYALCDQEAMIKYTPKDIEEAKKKYSLLLIPHYSKMEIIKNSWNIDGLTDRVNCGTEYIPIKCNCPICNKYEFDEEYDICPICSWEHDLVQESDEDYGGGANQLSVKEARILYKLQNLNKELAEQILNKHLKAIEDINNSQTDNNDKMIKNKAERDRYANEILQEYKKFILKKDKQM